MRKKILVSCIASLFIAGVLYLFFEVRSENRDIYTEIYKGDSKSYQFTIRNSYTYKPVDLMGTIIKFRVKKNPSDSSYIINKTCTLSDPENGQVIVTLLNSDTDINAGTYYAYLTLTNSSGTYHEDLLRSKWIIKDKGGE